MSLADKPNILYILADDLGWGDVSFHGSPIRTPTLDRLAETGVELTHHYVCPMCTPTRASLLSGRHPGRFGRHATTPSNAPVFPDGYATLATYLRQAGYRTGLFGKWHLGSSAEFGPNRYGFDYAYGSLAGGVDPYNHCYKTQYPEYMHTWHRNGTLVRETGHVTDLIVREASEWIRGQASPWFCYVPFTAVHVPVKAPQQWLDRYEFGTYDADPKRDRSFKRYAAYASQMDAGVGRLIETLTEMGRLEDTIVVFASDNGAIYETLHESDRYPGLQEQCPRLGSNLPLRGQKAQMYEGGIRTPAVLSWPGTLAPGTRDAPLQVTDWMPTLLSLVGCTPEEDPRWDGVDVGPYLWGGAESPLDRDLFWNFRGVEFGLREKELKLILRESEDTDELELYNLHDDPYETTDLAGSKPDVVERLRRKIGEQRTLDGTSVRPDGGGA
jgi:arylsulfatase A-like enzyme